MTAILEDAKNITVNKWGTLNTSSSPTKLPEGHSPNNLNVWMDEKPGSVVTANGYIKLGELPSGLPPTLLLNYFKTSDGSSQLICSDNSNIYWTTDYVNYTTIKTGLSASFQLRGKVIRDKVWFTNGSDAVATWDGSSYVELDGSPDVPPGKYIEYHDERVWIYGISTDLSSCRFSALTDTSGVEIPPDDADAWPVDNEIQVSEGDADQGTGIFVYRGYLYCSKQFSIWRIVGYDEYTYSRVKTRSSTGTRFQESIQIKDNLVHLIGVDGMYVFDGEESKRISDIIDPASAEEGVFAFRNLQQPLLNNKFWNVSATADFDNGTVPDVIDVSNAEIRLKPADDSETEFTNGDKTRLSSTIDPGFLQLNYATSGAGPLMSEDKACHVVAPGGGIFGTEQSATDGASSPRTGLNCSALSSGQFVMDLGTDTHIAQIIVRSYLSNAAVSIQVNTGAYEASGDTNGDWDTVDTITSSGLSVVSQFTSTFSDREAIQVRLLVPASGLIQFGEIEVYRTAYETDGKFVSSAIDYGAAPASFGFLTSDVTPNGETYQFFTQSSDDGSTWDTETNVDNRAAITSTLRRYLRWGVYLYSSDGAESPSIDKTFVGGTYISEVHDTGGNILQWASFQADQDSAGQTVQYYFRAASTGANVLLAAWTEIVPGAVPNTAITNQYIQIRVELSTENVSQTPSVQGFRVNWTASSASGAAITQNVASFVWLNRYWLAAATLGAEENDIVLVLGKSTFGSPWHKRDFGLLSFCRFQDIFIAGSSEDGSLYRLEFGFSKNGDDMDSYYETQDFSIENFQIKGREILLTADRSGPYSLSVGWSTDGGLTYTEKDVDLTREDGDSLSFTKKLNINFISDTVRFRVRINAADQPFSVDELVNYYRLTLQRGSFQ